MQEAKRQIRQIGIRIWEDLKAYRIAIVLFVVWNIVVRMFFHAFCPFLIVTGFPCAGCGLTRAVFFILTGRFTRGMKLNPAALFWIVWILWFFWNRYVYGRSRKRTMFWLGVVCVITLVIYIYRMIHYFPSDPPMVYFPNNVIRKLLSSYH